MAETLASGGFDSTVRLWNLSTFQELMRLEAHTGVVSSLTFSDDGKLLASGGQAADGPSELFLWSAEPWIAGRPNEGGRLGVVVSGSRLRTYYLGALIR
jgi:WD40 repeat protein